ncbi:calcium-binding protein, partial [Streptomyces sp. SID4931]
GAWVDANDGDFIWTEKAKSFKFQRASRLSANASPEPVKKGKTLTVTGKLERANWDTFKYHGYTKQPVKLQFKKKGVKSYTTVKTIKTSSTGTLKTTVKASADGHWRYSFAGTSTTPAVSAAGDYVDVK